MCMESLFSTNAARDWVFRLSMENIVGLTNRKEWAWHVREPGFREVISPARARRARWQGRVPDVGPRTTKLNEWSGVSPHLTVIAAPRSARRTGNAGDPAAALARVRDDAPSSDVLGGASFVLPAEDES